MVQPILYYSNIIDYIRIGILYVCFLTYQRFPTLTTVILAISDIFDAFDGSIARKYNQLSYLGACLDMVIDRLSYLTVSMMIISFPISKMTKYVIVWSAQIDIVSHWLRFSMGTKLHTHHKLIESQFFLLKYYYQTRWFMAVLCICAQTYLISTYYSLSARHKYARQFAQLCRIVTVVPYVLKTYISIQQLVDTILNLNEIDIRERK